MADLKAFIEQKKVQCRLIEKPSTKETLKAHETLERLGYRVSPDQMIKALVCIPISEGKYLVDKAILALVSGTQRLSLEKLQNAAGYERIVIADQKTAERLSGYPRGGTPPIGHESKMSVVVDDELARQSMLYGGGGSTEQILEISYGELSRVIKEACNGDFQVLPIHE